MTEKFPPELQSKFTNELLEDFAKNMDKALRNRLSQIRPKVPSQTIQSLRYEIMEAKAADISANYKLFFQDSGRISEMKKVNYRKQLPVDVIIDWIKKNRSKFQQVPGYQNKPENLSQAKQVSRIAWAILKSRSKTIIRRGRKKKERTWVNPTFYGFVNRLIEEFITKQGEFIQNAYKEAFTEAIKIKV